MKSEQANGRYKELHQQKMERAQAKRQERAKKDTDRKDKKNK